MLINVGMLKDIFVAYFIKNYSVSDVMTSPLVYFSYGQTDRHCKASGSVLKLFITSTGTLNYNLTDRICLI
jgi:hypothetical protein